MITINLLPPREIRQLKMARLYSFALQRAILLSVFGFLILILFIAADLRLRNNLKIISQQLEDRQAAVDTAGFLKLRSKIDQFNKNLEQVAKLQDQHIRFSPVLSELVNLTPPEIKFTYLNFGQDDGIIELRGNAATREGLLRFQERMSQSDFWEDLDFPLSNLESRENVDFQIKFKVKNEYLR